MEGYSVEPSNPFQSTMHVDNPQVASTSHHSGLYKNHAVSSSDPSHEEVDTIMEDGARNSLGLDEIPLMDTHHPPPHQRHSPNLLDDTFDIHPIPGESGIVLTPSNQTLTTTTSSSSTATTVTTNMASLDMFAFDPMAESALAKDGTSRPSDEFRPTGNSYPEWDHGKSCILPNSIITPWT